MSVLLVTLMLGSCQTFSPIKLPKSLNRPCPIIDFSAGKLLPQVVRLKTEYELCRVNNDAVIGLF